MTYWGSDARLYSVADARNPYHRFMGDDPASETRRRQSMERIGRRISLATVPDIELREHVAPYFDRVEVVPVVLRTKDVIPTYVRDGSEPLVVHAPSKRHIKGTQFVLEAVEELRRRGVSFHDTQERVMGFEPTNGSLGSYCLTTWRHPQTPNGLGVTRAGL